jgi:hypothetical protein
MKKIAFDVHGTLDKNPDVILPMMEKLILKYSVVIISGPPTDQIYQELKKLECEFIKHFDIVYSVVDYIKRSGVKMHQHDNGNWYCDDEEWWKSKGRMCDEFGIDMIFDNEIKYKKWMSEHVQFIHWG